MYPSEFAPPGTKTWEAVKAEAVRTLALAAASDCIPDRLKPDRTEMEFAHRVRREAAVRGEVLWNHPSAALPEFQIHPFDYAEAEENRRILDRIAEEIGPDVYDRWVNDDGTPEPDLAAEVRSAIERAGANGRYRRNLG